LTSVGLSVELERGEPAVVVRPRGTLTALSAPDLRAALLEALAEQPVALIVDASALAVDDDVALAVLATVARQAQDWPGTRLALAGATPDVAAAAERLGVTRLVSLCADVPTARGALAGDAAPPTTSHVIQPDRNAPSVARAAVARFCQDLGVRENDAAQLVASELVTNAVVHTGTTMQLRLRLVDSRLHIAVRDGGDGVPRLAGIIDEASESGRGLLLVDALAARWGTFVPDRGKIVWATVRVKPTPGNGRTTFEQA
jgi:anti-anti-sigma regulatory factor/anti-sigma regulatory factor (Ser/Thr protein kinase)